MPVNGFAFADVCLQMSGKSWYKAIQSGADVYIKSICKIYHSKGTDLYAKILLDLDAKTVATPDGHLWWMKDRVG